MGHKGHKGHKGHIYLCPLKDRGRAEVFCHSQDAGGLKFLVGHSQDRKRAEVYVVPRTWARSGIEPQVSY